MVNTLGSKNKLLRDAVLALMHSVNFDGVFSTKYSSNNNDIS